MKVWLPTRTVPLRACACVLVCTEYASVPSRSDEAPPVSEIHVAFDPAVHAQPLVTWTVPLPPAAGRPTCVGFSVWVHTPAGCWTEKRSGPT